MATVVEPESFRADAAIQSKMLKSRKVPNANILAKDSSFGSKMPVTLESVQLTEAEALVFLRASQFLFGQEEWSPDKPELGEGGPNES
jgi:hypothetical protein